MTGSWNYIPYAPWCRNIYEHLPEEKHPVYSFVGKYASTMEHMGIYTSLYVYSSS